MIDEATLAERLARLHSVREGDREEAADSVTDLTTSYSSDQAGRLVTALTRLAASESNAVAREAQLHAASELVEWHPAARAAAEVGSLDRAALSVSEQEYVDFLAEPGTAR